MKKTSVEDALKNLKPRHFESQKGKEYAYEKAIILNEEDIGASGARYQIISMPPKSKVRPHYHENVSEVYLIERGIGLLTINGQNTLAKKGDVIVIEKKDVHALENTFSEPFVFHVFKWNEDQSDIKFV